MSLAVTPHGGRHISLTSTGSHIFALCLPRLPRQIYIFPPDASVLLQSESGPGIGMWLKPVAWMSWRLLHTQHSRMYNVTCFSQTGSSCPCLLYQGCSLIQTKQTHKECPLNWYPRVQPVCLMDSALLCSCSAVLCYLSSRFLYYSALDCYIFNQK